MTTEVFKKMWKDIEGKPVIVEYGKRVIKNVTLCDYNESLRLVHTTMKGSFNTASIKNIALIHTRKEKPIEVEAQPVEVEPRLPEGWDKNGFFRISGKFGGNWKRIEYIGPTGEVEITSKVSMKHEELFQLILKLKQPTDKREAVEADVIIDDTYCAQVYYYINKHLSISKII